MGLALHPYIVGQPYRLRHLRRALEHLAHARDRGEIWFTTPGAIELLGNASGTLLALGGLTSMIPGVSDAALAAAVGVVVAKRRGTTAPGAQYVLMTVDDLVTLLGGTADKETP